MDLENLYTPNCIRTFTGKYIDPCNPNPHLICIEDIAHALSMQPRFGGHLPVWYSVAQHSVKVATACAENGLQALMHDASEAYLMDIPSPVKHRLSNYKEIEDGLMKCIADKFKFDWPMSDECKEADKMQLESEWEYIMLLGRGRQNGWGFKKAKAEYINYFNNFR